jgi:hypothetical protein
MDEPSKVTALASETRDTQHSPADSKIPCLRGFL